MATTPNIGLYKPTRDDYVSVQRDLSNNYDLIDAAVGQNNTLLNDMDIVINGSSSSDNVTKGQFVTVRNSTITGITDGVYRSKSNKSSGTAFTSSDLEQVTSGTLNFLNEKYKTTIVDCPSVESTSVSAGVYVTDKTVNISETGYHAIGVSLYRNNNPNWFCVNVGFANSTSKIQFNIYHARNTSDDSWGDGAAKALVLWEKD